MGLGDMLFLSNYNLILPCLDSITQKRTNK